MATTKTMEFLNNRDYKGLFLYAKENVDRFYEEINCDKYEGFERSKCIWLREVLEEEIGGKYEDEIFEINNLDYFARKVEKYFKELERAMKGYEEFKFKTGSLILVGKYGPFILKELKETYHFMEVTRINGETGYLTNAEEVRLATEEEKEIFNRYYEPMKLKNKILKKAKEELEEAMKKYEKELEEVVL